MPETYSLAEPAWICPVRLRAIATAVPGQAVTQAEIAMLSERVFDGRLSDIRAAAACLRPCRDRERAISACRSSGTCRPIAGRSATGCSSSKPSICWPKWPSEAIEAAGCDIGDIDALVAVSTTGVATPSLDALVMERLGMRRDIAPLAVVRARLRRRRRRLVARRRPDAGEPAWQDLDADRGALQPDVPQQRSDQRAISSRRPCSATAPRAAARP